MMEVERLAEGLWRWSVEPGRWSIYAETPRAILLVDPLLPEAGSPDEERFFEALDRDVARCERPVFVVETSIGRAFDAVRIHDRYRPPRHEGDREDDDLDAFEAAD
jgi:hypothetical protein